MLSEKAAYLQCHETLYGAQLFYEIKCLVQK